MDNGFCKTSKGKITIPLLLLPVWFLMYHYLQPFTDWLVFDAFGMTKGEHLAEALWFFIFEFPKVMLLLIGTLSTGLA